MAEESKILGQAAPAAATDTTLYTVPAGKGAVISTLVVANRGAQTTFRVAVRPAGAPLGNDDYLMYDATLVANGSAFLTIGLTLAATDVITVRGATGDLSFNAFGVEVDV